MGATGREPHEIDSGAAADIEHRFAAVAREVDETREVVQLLEVIGIEIVEESRRADRMPGDLEVMNVPLPVAANLARGHAA